MTGNEMATGRDSRRPPNNFIKDQVKDTTSPPDLSTIITKPGEKIAYLSVPSSWSDEVHSQALQRVRDDLPDLHIESYQTAFTLNQLLDESTSWPERFEDFITNSSTLIVTCDDTRIVGIGIRHELQTALRLKKRIIIFDVTEGCLKRYFGFDHIKDGSIRLRRGLRTKAENEELARRLKKRLKKREKEQRRLAGKMAEEEVSTAVDTGEGVRQ
jgi:hypothetical protein